METDLLESDRDNSMEFEESVVLLNESSESKKATLIKTIENDSDYSSKASSKTSNSKKNKIVSDDEEDEYDDDESEIEEEEDEDEENESEEERESDEKNESNKEEEEEETFDEDYVPNEYKKNRSKRKIKTSNKKDLWIDDESHDSVSDCDLDSDTQEKPLEIKVNDNSVFDLIANASEDEIKSTMNVSEALLKKIFALRPFNDRNDMELRLRSNRLFYVINKFKDALYARSSISNLIDKCKEISKKIKKHVNRITNATNLEKSNQKESKTSSYLDIKNQPKVLNKKMTMKSYQLIGLNWLVFMYENGLNACLCDEMGVGKTCQAIAFLAHLYEKNKKFMHLIVVPASTLENWAREISNWFPSFNFKVYRGSPDERSLMRKEIKEISKKKSAKPLNAILTTYSYVSGNDKDKEFFRNLKIECCIYDEAHALKNMKTVKYGNLMQIKSKRKLLLTGTPLQNNLVELMSLMYFVTPSIFQNQTKFVTKLFMPDKIQNESNSFYREKIKQARTIMDVFILRRLKEDVLKELPEKSEKVIICQMTPHQEFEYNKLLDFYKKRKAAFVEQTQKNAANNGDADNKKKEDSMFGVIMELRKAACHPLLRRCLYTDEKIREMAHLIMKESDSDTRYDYVVEDMSVMNDFELHCLCPFYQGLKGYELSQDYILNSGKFKIMKELLQDAKQSEERVLIFSQFKIQLEIVEEFLRIIGHKYLRLDGSTKVEDRQSLIDKFNQDKNILVFMLTTKAGGVGINLVGASRVILHDIDYNPQNDKQAEDRCHRVGQEKEVQVFRLISKNTIDEAMLKTQADKLMLNAALSGANQESVLKSNLMKLMKDLLN